MNTFLLGLLFIYSVVFLRLSFGASTAERTHTTRPTELRVSHTRALSPVHHNEDQDIYNNEEEEELSGDYELDYPRVAFSTKPKDSSSVMPMTQNRRKGRGKKKNPCLRRKYRGYCVHGVCQHLVEFNHTTCRCELGYSGERCHLFTLPVGKEVEGYNQTAALVVISVILSLMCLTFFGILLAFRCHKKVDNEMESEEKTKLDADTAQ